MHCLDETDSTYLEKYKKVVYLGHRRFLPPKHPVRKKCKHFKDMTEHRRKPVRRTRDDIFGTVKDLEVIFGKGPGGQSVLNDATGHAACGRRNQYFGSYPIGKS